MSEQMQLQLAMSMINDYDLKLMKTYRDEKKSGYRKPLEKRSGLMKLIKDASQGIFKVLITMSNDRLSRNIFDMIKIVDTLENYNIKLVFSMPRLIQPCEQDIVYEMYSYANAMHEAERIGVRSRAALQEKISLGQWAGGALPYGYRLNVKTGAIEMIPEIIPIIKKIYILYISGLSCSKIASQLEPGLSSRGKWTKWQVEGIIKNPFYAGYLTWNKRKSYSNSAWRKPSEWIMIESQRIPKMIDKGTWDLAQGMLQMKKTSVPSTKHFSSPFLLKGLLTCSCGAKMMAKNRETTTTLKNGERKKYGKNIYYCPNKCIKVKADKINSFIFDDVKEMLAFSAKDDFNNKIVERIKLDLTEYSKQKAALEEKIKFLNNYIDRDLKQPKRPNGASRLYSSAMETGP